MIHPMIHPINHHLSSRRPAAHRLRKLLLLPIAGAFLALSSCKEDVPAPPAAYITDTAPLGEGLKVIAYAVLGLGVLGVLGKLVK
jgi:hypothetical protein